MATTQKINHTLGEICDFQTGYNVRGKLHTSDDGVQVVQLKDLSPAGEFNADTLNRAALGNVSERYLVKNGDIVFRTRFEPNTAYRLTGLREAVAVLAPVIILRPKSDFIDLDYLVWFIRQAPAQRYIDCIRQGTNLQQIPIDELKGLPISVQPIKTQRKLVEISQLSEQEHALSLEIAEKRKMLTSFALLQQVQKTQPHSSELGSKPSTGVTAPKDISPHGQ